MATAPKKPEASTTSDQRSDQLRQTLARREAPTKTLDTFESSPSPASAPVSVAGAAIADIGIDISGPGFGETDTTEVTGDASVDQDLAEQAGDVENEELAEGQAELHDYRSSKDEKATSLAPSEDPNFRPPSIDDRGSRLPGGGGGTSEGAISAGLDGSHEGGGSIAGGGGFPDGISTGADAVSAASGHQQDFSSLIGDPRDLVSAGGGNSSANDSDAVHAALGGLIVEQMNSRMSATSVADDGGALAEAIASADKEAPKPPPDLSHFQKAGDGMTAEEAAEAAEDAKPNLLDRFLDWVDGDFKMDSSSGTLPSRDFTGIEGFTPLGTTTQVEGGKAVGVANFETSMGKSLGSAKGGVKDPGSPDDDRRDAPPTEAELALRAATNRLLGRNDALVHGPATEINPGEQGEVFQHGNTPLATSAQRATALFGQPREEGAPEMPGHDLNAPPPGLDRGPGQGGDIDYEDGSGYTGPIRHEGPEDVQFGTQDPLIGLGGGPGNDDALPPEDDDDDTGKQSGKHGALAIFDNDD